MTVLWQKGPLTATEVFEALPPGHGWKQKTVNTFLARLAEKKAVSVDARERAYVYAARVSREACVQQESDSFLQRVFNGAAGDLVLHFCSQSDLTPDEIRELERFLKSKKAAK